MIHWVSVSHCLTQESHFHSWGQAASAQLPSETLAWFAPLPTLWKSISMVLRVAICRYHHDKLSPQFWRAEVVWIARKTVCQARVQRMLLKKGFEDQQKFASSYMPSWWWECLALCEIPLKLCCWLFSRLAARAGLVNHGGCWPSLPPLQGWRLPNISPLADIRYLQWASEVVFSVRIHSLLCFQAYIKVLRKNIKYTRR